MTDGVLRTLLTNLGSIVLALLLAVAVWIAATLQADPFAVQDYIGLPVVPVNQPRDTILYQGEETSVSVTVRAPQSVLDNLDSSDLQITVDLAAVPLGADATIPISVTVQDPGVRILDYDPAVQRVRLEALGTITLPVEIELTGEVPLVTRRQPGDPAQPGSCLRSPARPATGRVDHRLSRPGPGPRRHCPAGECGATERDRRGGDRSRVGARTGPGGRCRAAPGGLQARGRGGARSTRGTGRRLPARQCLGFAGHGYPGRSHFRSGQPAGFVKTLPISITGATADLSLRAPLTVPNSVVVVETNFVTVSVEILPILAAAR